MTFVSLHNHSDYSPQDGAQTCKQIATKAARLNMPAVALTDHGRAGGLLQFQKECQSAGVKPILGYEAYVAPESHTLKERLENHSKASYHLTLLAKNDEGLKNIFRLTSIGWLEGYYYKPRISLELLKKYSEGIVALSGCGSSRTSIMILEGRMEEAVSYTRQLREVFKDDFYIEVQNHNIPWQQGLKKALFILSDKLSIPIVATQDSHYQEQEDSKLHNSICKLVAGDLTFDSDQSWFKSESEMKDMYNNSMKYLGY